jgi:serine/threonine protein kinase
VQVKICDFGLAKYSSSSVTSHSLRATSARTLEYSSPERNQDGLRTKLDDIYAFGILMHFIATSRSPYPDICAADLERVVRNGRRPDIGAWASEGEALGQHVRRVVEPYCDLARRCWHELPEQRPAFEAIFSGLEDMAGGM